MGLLPPYQDDDCPARGVGLSHAVEMTRFGPRCRECGSPVRLFKSDDPMQHIHQVHEPMPEEPWNVNAWLLHNIGVDVEQRMRDLGLIDDPDGLPKLRDLDTTPPTEGQWIKPDEAAAKGSEFQYMGRWFGQIAVKVKGLQAFWATRPEDDH